MMSCWSLSLLLAIARCFCLGPTLAQARERATLVAVGDVIQVRDTVSDLLSQSPQRAQLATIVLRYGWKRPTSSDTVTVLDPLAMTDCSAALIHGMRVLVFALERKGRLAVSLCTPNGPVARGRRAAVRDSLGPPAFGQLVPDSL